MTGIVKQSYIFLVTGIVIYVILYFVGNWNSYIIYFVDDWNSYTIFYFVGDWNVGDWNSYIILYFVGDWNIQSYILLGTGIYNLIFCWELE